MIIHYEHRVILTEGREALGHPFSNQNNYSINIEWKLKWKNKIESKKLNMKPHIKYEIVMINDDKKMQLYIK